MPSDELHKTISPQKELAISPPKLKKGQRTTKLEELPRLSSLKAGRVHPQSEKKAADLFQRARDLALYARSNEEFMQIIDLLNKAISVCSIKCGSNVYLARADAYRMLNEYDHAIDDYSTAIKLEEIPTADHYISRGKLHEKLKHVSQALEDFAFAIYLDPKESTYYYDRGHCLHAFALYKEAIADFTQAIQLGANGKSEYSFYAYRGNCHRKVGAFDECFQDLHHASQLEPKNTDAMVLLAKTYWYSKAYQKGIEIYTQALALTPGDAALFFARGSCYMKMISSPTTKVLKAGAKQNSFDVWPTSGSEKRLAWLAIIDFTRCIKTGERVAEAYFRRGSVRILQALYFDKAIDFSSLHLGDNTFGDDIHGLAGELIIEVQDLGPMEAACKDIVFACELCPGNPKYTLALAMIAQREQKFDAAASHLASANASMTIKTGSALQGADSVTRKSNENLMIDFQISLCYLANEEYEPALVLLTQLIDLSPSEALLHEARAHTFMVTGYPLLAIQDLKLAEELSLQNLAFNRHLQGECYFSLAQYQEAVDCHRIASENFEKSASALCWWMIDTYHTRAMAFYALQDYTAAMQDFNICVSNAPDSAVYRYHRGLCYSKMHNNSKALVDFQQALHGFKQDAQLHFHIGQCYLHERNTIACRSVLEEAIQMDNSSSLEHDILYRLALCDALEKDYAKAIERFTNAINVFNGTNLLSDDMQDTLAGYRHERAKVLQWEKRYADAVQDFDAVLLRQPENANALFRRAFAHKSLKNLHEAAADFGAAGRINSELIVDYKAIVGVECLELCAAGCEPIYRHY